MKRANSIIILTILPYLSEEYHEFFRNSFEEEYIFELKYFKKLSQNLSKIYLIYLKKNSLYGLDVK